MNKLLKILVAGGRDYNDKGTLYKALDMIISKLSADCGVEIVAGGARGADYLGKRYAFENHIPYKEFPAKWDTYGKSAGYRRNAQMAEYVSDSGLLVVAWDGKSKGTSHMIDTAKRKNIPVYLIEY